MSELEPLGAAEQAAEDTFARVIKCIDERKDFILEAGAGAGKTYSLIGALRYLIEQQGSEFLRRHQQVACITYTNVARDEIESRTDGHPAVCSSTIHAFCWSLIRGFQQDLRNELPGIGKWAERLDGVGGAGTRVVDYDLGYPSVDDDSILLHHNDVLALTVALMNKPKFRRLLADRYPVLFIDEYQDTDEGFAGALKERFLGSDEGPLIGFFGDHWQKIYGDGCGKIEHPSLETIDKHSNFRSVGVIVDVLNQMRPELPQHSSDEDGDGFVAVRHTNGWSGKRQTGAHWNGDLPSDVAHEYLQRLMAELRDAGWDFSPEKTKVLMLTHNVLAEEQGYRQLAGVFSRNESFIKKEDKHIAFFADVLEPACAAYSERKFGEMFSYLGGRRPAIHSKAEKAHWVSDMDELLALRETGTVGEVIDHLRKTGRPRLPEALERKETDLLELLGDAEAEKPSWATRLENLRPIPYSQVIALANFINGHTPFSTKHGVKGAEFENVLVVVGRGWSQYNFAQMLEWFGAGTPADKVEAFERSRNLFYVVCSRPMKRLMLLFTQELSDGALTTLQAWFGPDAVEELPVLA